MALVRAMNSAISGLGAQQRRIDVIGDNLANVNTHGFKTARLNFETMLSQTISYGAAPSGNLGGVDPLQYGLGVQIGDSSKSFTQGTFEATGVNTDLAIEGDGFFTLKDVAGDFVYTRDGSFTINPANLLHSPSNGYIVQGWQADYTTFQIPANGPLTNIEIPVGMTIVDETENASFEGNLRSSGDVGSSGTVLLSEQLYDSSLANEASGATVLSNLGVNYGGAFRNLGLVQGTTIRLTATKGARSLPDADFLYDPSPPSGVPGGTTLTELSEFMEDALGISVGDKCISGQLLDGIADAGTDQTTLIDAGNNFVTAGITGDPINGDFVRFTSGSANGQIARITSVDSATQLTMSGLTTSPGVGDTYVIHEPAEVTLQTDVVVTPDYTVRVAGNTGSSNHITNLTLTDTSTSNRLFAFTQDSEATGESTMTNTYFYDSLGEARSTELTFTHEGITPSGHVFRYFVECDDDDDANRAVGNGTITFDREGKYVSASPTQITIDLENEGAEDLVVNIDFSSLTGFANELSEVYLGSQDGAGKGEMNDFAIDADGKVRGIFTNGEIKDIAQVALTRFRNNNGLIASGSNIFEEGINSGEKITGQAGTLALGSVRSGFLEESNVDISKEFTNLIVSQRAFQANARTITVSDQMLQELVNMI